MPADEPHGRGPQPQTAATVLELASDGTTVGAARRATDAFLRLHCPWADRPAVAAVLTELLTNAARHTAGPWRLRVVPSPARLVVEVQDSSSRIPTARTPDLSGACGGLGMHIVARLAQVLEVEPNPEGTGKRIRALWFSTAEHTGADA